MFTITVSIFQLNTIFSNLLSVSSMIDYTNLIVYSNLANFAMKGDASWTAWELRARWMYPRECRKRTASVT